MVYLSKLTLKTRIKNSTLRLYSILLQLVIISLKRIFNSETSVKALYRSNEKFLNSNEKFLNSNEKYPFTKGILFITNKDKFIEENKVTSDNSTSYVLIRIKLLKIFFFLQLLQTVVSTNGGAATLSDSFFFKFH